MSFETNFDLKQLKLEPKQVSAPSETIRLLRLFRLFRFYTETECFSVLIEPKQTEEQPKGFHRGHKLVLYCSYVALFCIERDCLSKTEIGEREIYMHSKCM